MKKILRLIILVFIIGVVYSLAPVAALYLHKDVHGPTNEQVAEKLKTLCERMELLPDRILLYADDAEKVLDEIHKIGLHPVTSLVRRSSLEDVFLRLTGRTLVE